MASECRVSELKNATPDSRISRLSVVSSSLASVSSLSNPSLRVFIRYLEIMFRLEATNEAFYFSAKTFICLLDTVCLMLNF